MLIRYRVGWLELELARIRDRSRNGEVLVLRLCRLFLGLEIGYKIVTR